MFRLILPQANIDRILRLYLYFRVLAGRRTIVSAIVSSLCLSFLDFFGLVFLFPFIKIATDPQFQVLVQSKATTILPIIASFGSREFVAVLGVVVLLYFVTRTFAYEAITRHQFTLASNIVILSTQRLLNVALRARYQLFLDEGAVKIAGISYSNTVHASLLFQSVVSILNEATIILIIFIAFAWISPMSIIILMLFGLLFVRFALLPFARKAAILGGVTRDGDMSRHRFVHSMIIAIRDVKIMGLEGKFLQRNYELVRRHARVFVDYQSISLILRLLIDALMMVAVIAVCLWFVYSSVNLADAAPFLATLGLAFVRIAPAMSRMAANLNSFRFSLPVVEALFDLEETIAKYPQERSNPPVSSLGDYTARDLRFSYREREIIDGASLNIPNGGVVAIIGPSGSGKSTLLDLLSGLQEPSSGEFILNGKPFSPFLSENFNQLIGYVPQSIALFDDSLQFNIALEADPDAERLAFAVEKAHLESLIASLPQGLNTALGEGGVGISGGQRQRIGIARALYRRPSLLILDEVTSALDAVTARSVMEDLLNLRGTTSILIVSHDMTLVSADKIYQMVDGRLFAI